MLAVVEHQQPRTTFQRCGDTVRQTHPRLLDDSEDSGDSVGHRGWIADRRQFDHPYPVREVVGRTRGYLQRKSRLAHATDTGQCHQLMCLESRLEVEQLVFAADEAGASQPQAAWRWVDGLQRWKIGL